MKKHICAASPRAAHLVANASLCSAGQNRDAVFLFQCPACKAHVLDVHRGEVHALLRKKRLIDVPRLRSFALMGVCDI